MQSNVLAKSVTNVKVWRTSSRVTPYSRTNQTLNEVRKAEQASGALCSSRKRNLDRYYVDAHFTIHAVRLAHLEVVDEKTIQFAIDTLFQSIYRHTATHYDHICHLILCKLLPHFPSATLYYCRDVLNTLQRMININLLTERN